MKIKLANDEQLSVCTLKDNVQGCLVIDADGKIDDYMASDAKIQKIYNADGTDALDDKGQLFKSAIETGGHWEVDYTVDNITTHYTFAYTGGASGSQKFWTGTSASIYYTPWTGTFTYSSNSGIFTLSPTIQKQLDPEVQSNSDAMGGVYTYTNGTTRSVTATYVPMSSQLQTTSYARFAIEAMPTAWTANTAYTVGVCASSDGKAYRCTTEHTSGAEFDPSKWIEIPVLAQKADAADLPYSLTTKTVASAAVTLDDRAVQAITLEDATTAVTLPATAEGKVTDLVLEVHNVFETDNTPSQAEIAFTGIGTDYSVVLQDGKTLADVQTFAANEYAEVYITRTAFNIDSKPTWKIVKQTLIPATVS